MRNEYGQFAKGLEPWNKGTKGIMKANSGSFKKGDNTIPLEKRFWDKVAYARDWKCWLWTGSTNNTGYGRININRKVKLAHRVSFEMKNGKIKEGMSVLHRCDNPLCVNPKHLMVGTRKENNADMWAKNRGIKGENASWSKLTQEKVDDIRKIYQTEKISMRKLARNFNVSYTTINFIIHKKTWK